MSKINKISNLRRLAFVKSFTFVLSVSLLHDKISISSYCVFLDWRFVIIIYFKKINAGAGEFIVVY